MVPSSNVRYSYVATFQNFQSSSKIELFRIILCQNSRDHRLYSPRIRNLVMECSRKIRRINYEKYAGNEERSTTDGKMECIVEGTDNSKESSLSVSKYRNLYSVNNRLAIVRPPLCSGGNARMSQTLEIGWKLCVKRRTTSLDYESLKTIISILEDERRMKRNAVENEEETKARRDYSRLECSEGNRPSSANFPPEKKEMKKGRRATIRVTFEASATQPEDRRCIVVAYHRKKPYS